MRQSIVPALILGLLGLGSLASSDADLPTEARPELEAAPSGTLLHPHFPKHLEVKLDRRASRPEITLDYQTATCNAEEFNKAREGQIWHLAGARIETTKTLNIGGKSIKAGRHNLMARKKGSSWELLLGPITRNGFGTQAGEGTQALATTYGRAPARKEHLFIDVHPGDGTMKGHLVLEVWFDTNRALVKIES